MRTLTGAVITGFIALLVAGVASAAPTVALIWTGTTGAGATGSSSIDAVAGDTLTLDIQVTPDGAGVSAGGVSLDYLSGGSTLNLFYRPSFDGINDGTGTTFMPAASATNTGGGYAFVPGSTVTCPGGALGNLAPGFCGNNFQAAILPQASDLGGGIVGSFQHAGTGNITATYTIGQAQFVVVPEPATGGLLALGLGALGLIGRRNA